MNISIIGSGVVGQQLALGFGIKYRFLNNH